MKKIGLLGVCVGGTTSCYLQLMKMSLNQHNTHTPHVLVYNTDLYDYFSAFNELFEGDDSTILSLIQRDLANLTNFGVDFVIIPNNTVHCIFNKIREMTKIPLVSALDAVNAVCVESNYSNVLVLGSKWLLDSEAYQISLINNNISSISLNESERILFHKAIMLATKTGKSEYTASHEIKTIIEDYITKKNIDAVVLGCSDLVKQYHNELTVPTIDPMYELASISLRVSFTGS